MRDARRPPTPSGALALFFIMSRTRGGVLGRPKQPVQWLLY
jgi:hypothetical protein